MNEAFVGFHGLSRELTSDVVASDPIAAGEKVAQAYVSSEPRSRVSLVSDDGATVIYDVLDIGDDAVKGYRLTVVTEPVSGGTAVSSFTEQTICSRGLAPDLRCV
ncbi:MAG: hypothetical protein HKN24_13405 [Acidimicrobiales bacterium]|nr:hypothetical protein [Acidimicrobiales bacterium]